MKVLMVCLGNICRSPLAHGILAEKMKSWEVDSAGTANYHIGKLPDPRSIKVAKDHGLDITYQRARQIEKKDLSYYDLILTMDAENYNNVLKLADHPSKKEKVQLILNFLYPGENRVVPDPYYNGRFEEVYMLLDKATDAILNQYST
ncbi:low molecular weight protein-tyrosine-phosphatase [Portibacter marinus]|uniref:low molecular weight protein-tyrosine-phosphatase n=1 Tax=Portibacter marinus TaxID=2898660 RepID=UPI001F1E0AC2|nr:low molecular weight protein-tyrosine-phosphatase [Portibacter marinus]